MGKFLFEIFNILNYLGTIAAVIIFIAFIIYIWNIIRYHNKEALLLESFPKKDLSNSTRWFYRIILILAIISIIPTTLVQRLFNVSISLEDQEKSGIYIYYCDLSVNKDYFYDDGETYNTNFKYDNTRVPIVFEKEIYNERDDDGRSDKYAEINIQRVYLPDKTIDNPDYDDSEAWGGTFYIDNTAYDYKTTDIVAEAPDGYSPYKLKWDSILVLIFALYLLILGEYKHIKDEKDKNNSHLLT